LARTRETIEFCIKRLAICKKYIPRSSQKIQTENITEFTFENRLIFSQNDSLYILKAPTPAQCGKNSQIKRPTLNESVFLVVVAVLAAIFSLNRMS